MTETVVSLVERRAAPNASVVERLERLLKRARRGEIANLAFAYVEHDGGVGQGWSAGPNAPALIGALNVAIWRLCEASTGRSEPVPDEPT